MAVDAFIYFINPDRTKDVRPLGETTDDLFSKKAAFEIKEFSFDIENAATLGSATTGAGGGKAKFNEFTIKKPTDSASALFFRNCCAGIHYQNVIIALRKAGQATDAAGAPYLEYSFGMVFTTKIEWSGPGDEGPEESITFSYGQFAVRYSNQETDGSMTTGTPVGWDQTTNASWAGFKFYDNDGLS
jgi:type VI secretion system secreted protein Hcp